MKSKADALINEGKIHFSTEGRLLQELGERLVASSELAITELVKNAYDADATVCNVSFPDKYTLVISDDGHGMTFKEFKLRWMTIATSIKQSEQRSGKYHRKLTGAKGIGRFAVRYLGNLLTLISVAYDEEQESLTRLEAEFNWKEVDKLAHLEKYEIPYKVYKLNESVERGTKLLIRDIKNKEIDKHYIRTEVIKIVSPISGLERGKFDVINNKRNKDPGFTVNFSEGFESEKDIDINLAKNVLKNCWAQLIISLDQDKLKYNIIFNYSVENKKPVSFETIYPNHISNGLHADIRFFPYRAGIFRGKEIEGKQAWSWIKDNAGVGVVDHGFRIKPYGFKDDDWLNLDTDHSHSRRKWRTDLMLNNFPMTEEQEKRPALNPMLNIAVTHQLVGAVFVESSRLRKNDIIDLIPAMDREGFIDNIAFRELQEIVRAGLEYLALKDKEEEEKREEQKTKEATKILRSDLRAAIKEIEDNPSIPQSERNVIIQTYGKLAKEIESVDEYHRTSKQNLELISLLGVVSGFMTHETDNIVDELKNLRKELEKLSKQYPNIKSHSESINTALKELEGHIGYSTQFIQSIHKAHIQSFIARAQIEYVLDKFGGFAHRKGIQHLVEIEEDIVTPPLHVATYSGVFLNLYTNAVKSILLRNIDPSEGKILIRAINVKDKHILEIFDNGVGIPESLKERIWDPLFTTTSKLNSPLGTGMGLGLSLVKKIMTDLHGSVRLVDPIKDFITAFRVEYPFK